MFALDRAHLAKKGVQSTAGFVVFAVLVLASNRVCANDLIDENVRAQMLKQSDGGVAHLETEYNDLFIDKHGSLPAAEQQVQGAPRLHRVGHRSQRSRRHAGPVQPDHAEETKRILMIGLSAGSISTYLGRAMPDAQIDVVELDPGVIAAGKQYFGLRETDKVRFIESDGRVYLNRHKDTYDLILLDAFREFGVPFHMLTREFYALVKEHLVPGGAVASNVPPIRNFTFRLCSPCMRCSRLSMSIRPGANRTKHRAIAVAVSAPGPAAKSLMQCGPCVTEGVRFPLSVARSRRQTRHGAVFKECRRAHGFAPADLYRVIPIGVPKRQ